MQAKRGPTFVVKDEKLSGQGSVVFKYSKQVPPSSPALNEAYLRFSAKAAELGADDATVMAYMQIL
jgi:hypothetical protein